MKKIFLLVSVTLLFLFIATAQETPEYYFSKTIKASFEETTQKVKEALKAQQFGVITEIAMDKKLAEKLPDVHIEPYLLLGACNPKFAYETMQKEENIGLFLPCKVLIKYKDKNTTEVVMVNPSVLMQMLGNKELNGIADEVTQRFKKALDLL